jgi:hypothetical protein
MSGLVSIATISPGSFEHEHEHLVVYALDRYASMNEGEQKGKFITIYATTLSKIEPAGLR